MIIRTMPGWVIGEDAGGAEQRVPLRDLAMVDMEDTGDGWRVTIYLTGAQTGVGWLLPDCDEASQLVDDIAQAYDAAHAPMTTMDLLKAIWLEDLEVMLAGGHGMAHVIAGMR